MFYLQPHPNESLVNSNARKRHNNDEHDGIPRKSSKICRNSIGPDKTIDLDDYDDDDDEDDEDASQPGNSNITASQTSSLNSSQKIKRGRKMTIMTKDMDDSVIIDGNTTTSATSMNLNSPAAMAAKNKKKRGRKSNIHLPRGQTNSKEEKGNTTTASTSDEDEECSALNCIRPSGK